MFLTIFQKGTAMFKKQTNEKQQSDPYEQNLYCIDCWIDIQSYHERENPVMFFHCKFTMGKNIQALKYTWWIYSSCVTLSSNRLWRTLRTF